jgi:glycosyltransferase involved in cell wall biosynthesis
MSYRGLTLGVVIPAYQAELLIGKTISTLPICIDWLCVVNDGSTDSTVAQVLNTPRRSDLDFHLLHHDQNRGVGKAISTGYQYALQQARYYALSEEERLGFVQKESDLSVENPSLRIHLSPKEALIKPLDIIVVMGADAQMDPEELTDLIDALIDEQADYAKGNRFSHPEVRSIMPRTRYLGNRILSYLTKKITRDPFLQDAQCGYTAIWVDVLARLPLDLLYPRYGFPNDLLIRLHEISARVCHVPISPIYQGEPSFLKIHQVVFPIMLILMKGLFRKKWKSKALLNDSKNT